jgi:hypothetical protein
MASIERPRVVGGAQKRGTIQVTAHMWLAEEGPRRRLGREFAMTTSDGPVDERDQEGTREESERDSAEQHAGGSEDVRGRSGEGQAKTSPSSDKESIDRHGGGAEEAAESDDVHRRFSQGVEQTPSTPDKEKQGDFATGSEQDDADKPKEAG